MTVRKLVKADDPILHAAARPLERSDDLRTLIQDLWDTMHAYDGLGIAAPQIGVGVRVALVKRHSTTLALINARVSRRGMHTDVAEEACLSLPGLKVPVRRPSFVRVITYDGWPDPTAEDYAADDPFLPTSHDVPLFGDEARAALHELDHLDGILITDRRAEPRLHRRRS